MAETEWRKQESRSQPGRFYYFNCRTGESSWRVPQALKAVDVRAVANLLVARAYLYACLILSLLQEPRRSAKEAVSRALELAQQQLEGSDGAGGTAKPPGLLPGKQGNSAAAIPAANPLSAKPSNVALTFANSIGAKPSVKPLNSVAKPRPPSLRLASNGNSNSNNPMDTGRPSLLQQTPTAETPMQVDSSRTSGKGRIVTNKCQVFCIRNALRSCGYARRLSC